MSDDETEHTYSLVVPFIACASEGGPYDDAAFVAGYATGSLAAQMAAFPPPELIGAVPVAPATVAQLDLLAMHHGYTIETVPWEEHPDEWTIVTFRRV